MPGSINPDCERTTTTLLLLLNAIETGNKRLIQVLLDGGTDLIPLGHIPSELELGRIDQIMVMQIRRPYRTEEEYEDILRRCLRQRFQ